MALGLGVGWLRSRMHMLEAGAFGVRADSGGCVPAYECGGWVLEQRVR